jgi:bacterioferritin
MATAERTSVGILATAQDEKRAEVLELLERAYWMEIETVMSYIAGSVNPDGIRAREVAEALAEDVAEELAHAQRFARRIKELYGVVPGSLGFEAEQRSLQPPERPTDVAYVVRGVIEAERAAIEHYTRILEVTEGADPVTQDLVTEILADEQAHLRLFEGFLLELEEQA